MKVQFYGGNQFSLKTKDSTIFLNPGDDISQGSDFIALSKPEATTKLKTKKLLNLPGEYEVSGILAQGFFTDSASNIVYKILVEDINIAYLSGMTDVPESKFFEKLGESVDIALIVVDENFDEKKAKELISKIEPRMVVFGGDQSVFPKLIETLGVKVGEENPINIKKSGLSDDRTDIFVLNT